MRTLGRTLYLVLMLAVTAVAGWRTVDDLRFDPDRYGADPVGPDVREQLAALSRGLSDGAADRAAAQSRGGGLLTWALYGLANVEFGLRSAPGSTSRDAALTQARRALAALEDPAFEAKLPSEGEPPFGVQYQGWVQWLRGGVLLLQSPADRDTATIQAFRAGCGRMAAAWRHSASPLLESEPGRALPADNVVGLAALRLHDQLFTPAYEPLVAAWLSAARRHLDPATGLLPHDRRQGPRGITTALTVRFIAELDPSFAQDLEVAFRAAFLDRLLVVPAIREYPIGQRGPRDDDSGPLWGAISPFATAAAIGAAQVVGDAPLAGALLRSAELAGLPLPLDGGKRYAFGQAPLGDALLVWSKTARPWTRAIPERYFEAVLPGWRLWWYGVLLAIALLGWFPVLERVRAGG